MEKKISIQRIAAKAIIVNENNEVLILREAKSYEEGTNIGRYLLPGGRIEVGERYFDGLKREIGGETGLEIVVGEPIFLSEWFPVIKGIPHQIIGVFFACNAVTTAVTLSSEHDHYIWADPNNVMSYNMVDSDRKALEIYQNGKVYQTKASCCIHC